MSGTEPRFYPVLASALTHVHPGAGRSPGVVDLPVVRDPLGFFYVPGSGLKGALKSSLALRCGCVASNGEKIDCRGSGDCSLICCLFGGEVEESSDAPSRLSIGDLYPLLVPVPSMSHGVLYATSPYLVAAASSILSAVEAGQGDNSRSLVGLLGRAVERLREENKPVVVAAEAPDKLYLGLTMLTKENLVALGEEIGNDVLGLLENVNPAYGKISPKGRVIVVDDEWFLTLAERALVRLTRVRLDRAKKTVSKGALWTEEYIPRLTLFLGYVADMKHRGKYCENIDLGDDVVGRLARMAGNPLRLVLGGKETVGKGLVSLLIHGLSSQQRQ